ncbi:VOC family protein [Zoogloea sp. LCSB751]|uniref:VOC family protein n=1 Tax=Zoogloea sp. LCSB751 TaxID=1965277 RepID=UPI0009A4DF1C|nr:VOC family protein [Zoogloea sp. LCSB751]
MSNQSLISRLGSVMQMAYVPADVPGALRYWTETMGVGPFFKLSNIAVDAAKYKGEPASIDFSVYIAYWGDTQVEIIEQHNDAPSIYKSWRSEGREGLHHVCIVVADMARARGICAEAGATVLQEIWLPGGGEAIYVDAGGGPGSLIEMICFPPDNYAFFDVMRDAARHWDGSEPIRAVG